MYHHVLQHWVDRTLFQAARMREVTDVKTLRDLTDDDIRRSRWYYRIELRPGVYTDAEEHFTAALVREQLEAVSLRGSRCLDIGTQEGMIPVSLRRLGAGTVVTFDRLDLTSRIGLVKEAYGVEFEYLGGNRLGDLSGALDRAGHGPFDVVVFAGVLYHMIDPLAGLGIARSFVREGGLLLVETSAIVSSEMVLHFNSAGQHRPHSCYFLPSLSWLDYCLRMLRLRPLDVMHFSSPDIGSSCRVSVVCRAESRPLPFPGDTWMQKPWIENDFQDLLLDYAALGSSSPEIGYTARSTGLRFHDETASVDIFETVRQSKPWKRDPLKARLNLPDYLEGRSGEPGEA